MSKKKIVSVTSKDIEAARLQFGAHTAYTCPIARALQRSLSEYILGVDGAGTIIERGRLLSREQIVYDPTKIYRFVNDFDSKQPVHPFTFSLEILD